MRLTASEEQLIFTIRKFVTKGFDIEIRQGKKGTLKIIRIEKTMIKSE